MGGRGTWTAIAMIAALGLSGGTSRAQEPKAPGTVVPGKPAVNAPPPPPPPPSAVNELDEEAPPVDELPPPPPPPAPAGDDSARGAIKVKTVPAGAAGLPPAAEKTAEIKIGAEAIPSGQDLVNIDFPEPTEIKDIVKAVALWTGKNVILDKQVAGKVQIISPRRVTKEEAYQAFLSALNLSGFTTVETGKMMKILPVRTAVKGNLKTYLGSSYAPMTDEIITQIVPLKYIDANEVQNTLNRIVSSNSMVAYPPTNTLIISDSGYKVRRILDILKLLDVQGQQPQVVIVPIKYSDAKGVADKVTQIIGGSGKSGSGQRNRMANYKIIVDDRANAVIIFGPPRTISDVKELVRKFDIALDDPSKQASIHVRPLDFADAKKLSATLSALASGKSGSARRPPMMGGFPGAPPSGGPPDVAQLDDNVKITADESSNALLITGSHSAYKALNTLIRKLDVRRSQVYIEGDILDVESDNGMEFGTSIFSGAGSANGTKMIGAWEASKIGPLMVAQATAAASAEGSAANPAVFKDAAATFAPEMTIGILSGKTVNLPGLGSFSPGALIKLMKTDSNTRVLSSPHLLTSNNEDASISVGNRVYFKGSDYNAQTGVAIPKMEHEDVSLQVDIKPNISLSNYVTLTLTIASDSLGPVVAETGVPVINKRKTKQIVTVKTGQTIVVSGLVQTAQTETFRKVPLLGDIPILGWLFRNSSITNKKKSLMIFLTPHVVQGPEDLAAIYQSKVKERDEFMEHVYGSGFRRDDFYASVPKAEDGVYHPDANDAEERKRQEELVKSIREDVQDEPSAEAAAVEESENGLKKPKAKGGDETITVPIGGDEGVGGDFSSGPVGPAAPMPPPPPMDDGGPMDMPPPPPMDDMGPGFEPPPPMEN
jgi:general secretion pathway protein D